MLLVQIGVVRGGILHLCPVDGIYHMKPDLSHVDMSKNDVKDEPNDLPQEGLKQLNVSKLGIFHEGFQRVTCLHCCSTVYYQL